MWLVWTGSFCVTAWTAATDATVVLAASPLTVSAYRCRLSTQLDTKRYFKPHCQLMNALIRTTSSEESVIYISSRLCTGRWLNCGRHRKAIAASIFSRHAALMSRCFDVTLLWCHAAFLAGAATATFLTHADQSEASISVQPDLWHSVDGQRAPPTRASEGHMTSLAPLSRIKRSVCDCIFLPFIFMPDVNLPHSYS